MSWFTKHRHAAAAAPARPWLPHSLASSCNAWQGDVPPPPPTLAFDEGEMARMAAAMSLRARQDAQAACAADPATRLARALERMAEALADARRKQEQEDATAIRQTVELAAAIARAAAPLDGGPRTLADRIGDMLAVLDGPPGASLVVSPNVAEGLRPLLPKLAARAGFAGNLDLETDPGLPDGAAQLLWPGGWLEHDPTTLAARVTDLLAAHNTRRSPAATDGTEHEHDPA